MDDTATQNAIEDLMKVLEDGSKGFSAAADKLEKSTRPGFAATFRELGSQRMQYHADLESVAAQMGIHPNDRGSVGGAMHRGWMSIKDAMTGDDPKGVLDAAEQGEDHALAVYRKACESELNMACRPVVERQMAGVMAAHAQVKELRDSVQSTD